MWIDADPTIADEPVINPPRVRELGQLAYVIYTSGSTGDPKGVAISHEALANLVRWHHRNYAITPEDRASQIASSGFDASVWEIWPYLTAGASVHIVDDVARSDPEALWSWLEEHRITIAFLPTPLAEAALASPLPTALSLRALLTGGDRLKRAMAAPLPFEFVDHDGPTENTVVATCQRVGALSPPPIGGAIDNVRTYILDPNVNPAPIGYSGELHIGGSSLARGYLRRPDMTAERFVPDPWSRDGAARLYRTGDLARFDAKGELRFLGRADDQVKLRGFRIELGEIESVLVQIAGVEQAVAVVREDRPGDSRLVAYLVGTDSAAVPDSSEVQQFLGERLPSYMVPSAIVTLESFPRTPSGKLDRTALPKPEPVSSAERAPPESAMEIMLADVWREILAVDDVSVNDYFFDLGGHSLLAVEVVSRMEQNTGVRIRFAEFWLQSLGQMAI